MCRWSLSLIAAAGCAAPDEAGTLAVDTIEPAQGPADRAVMIRIDGRNFTRPIRSSVDDGRTTIADLTLALDGMPLATPSWRDETRLEAVVPAGLSPGSYDVELQIGDRAVTVPDGYTVTSGPSPVAPVLYAATEDFELWRIDPTLMTSERIGIIASAGAGVGLYMHALAVDTDGTLVGITAPPPIGSRALVRIDPVTAQVTSSVPISVEHSYWGATVAPAGTFGASSTLLVASNDDQNLYRVDSTGALSLVGSFGGDLRVAGDISYVPGDGLYATVTGGACAGTCIARVSVDGAATLLGTSGPGDLWGLAHLQGTLYAMGGSGSIYTVDRTTGALVDTYMTPISRMSDLAP